VIQLESPRYSRIFISLTKEKKDIVVLGFNVVGPFTQEIGFVSGFYSVDGTQILLSVLHV